MWKEISPDREWLRFFEELNRCAVTEVTLAGGEPFMREDLKEIIDGIVKNRMRFAILSNGTLIDEDMAAFLASTKRCNYVQVSIDGSMPESHDVMRGKGSFAKALQGLMTLRRNGVHAAVRVTIHRKNVHDLEGIAKFLLEDLRLSSFGTNSAGAMGLCRNNAEMVQLTTEDRMIAMETLLRSDEKIQRPHQRHGGAAGRSQGLARHGGGPERRKAADRRTADTSPAAAVTGRDLAVRADGAITPCTMLSHIELGRINRDDLGEIWRNHDASECPQGKTGNPAFRLFLLRRLSLRELLHGQLSGTVLHADRRSQPPEPRRLPAEVPRRGRQTAGSDSAVLKRAQKQNEKRPGEIIFLCAALAAFAGLFYCLAPPGLASNEEGVHYVQMKNFALNGSLEITSPAQSPRL